MSPHINAPVLLPLRRASTVIARATVGPSHVVAAPAGAEKNRRKAEPTMLAEGQFLKAERAGRASPINYSDRVSRSPSWEFASSVTFGAPSISHRVE